MQYLIAYDIADERRRDRMAQLLLNYGQRVQYSVFLAHLDEELAGQMREGVQKLVNAREDRVHIFVLCAACKERTVLLGRAEVQEDSDFYVV